MNKNQLTIEKRLINELKPHPIHQSIYITPSNIKSEWKDLYSGMKESGLLNPIIVTKDNIPKIMTVWMVLFFMPNSNEGTTK